MLRKLCQFTNVFNCSIFLDTICSIVIMHASFFFIIVLNVLCKNTASEDIAEETQHAICRIATQEIQTSANATIRRELKGVCTSREIKLLLQQLERKLFQELSIIKSEIWKIIDPRNDSKLYNDEHSEGNFIDYDYENDIPNKPLQSSRLIEISKYNDTVEDSNTYVYYWKVDNVNGILYKRGTHFRSQDFYVLGHQLCIQLYPEYMDSNSLGIQLRPSGNFHKEHVITVVNLLNSTEDIISETLGGVINNYMSIYEISNTKLQESGYIVENALIIKMSIDLTS